MITRLWQAWTTPENADVYEQLLTTEVFPEIRAKGIAGLKGFELLRRDAGDEVEFLVMMRFTDVESIRAMTGGAPEQAYVPEVARKVLKRFEETVRHFESRFSAEM